MLACPGRSGHLLYLAQFNYVVGVQLSEQTLWSWTIMSPFTFVFCSIMSMFMVYPLYTLAYPCLPSPALTYCIQHCHSSWMIMPPFTFVLCSIISIFCCILLV